MSDYKRPIPRLRDVAVEASVSLSTASRILRGEGERYAASTRKRVHEASQKLGWRKNQLVSSIQSGKTKTIGVMIPPYDSFWVGVLYGIHAALAEADYLPITIWPSGCEKLGEFERQKEEGFELISELLDRRVDGLLLWPAYSVAFCDHFRELSERAVPMGAIEHTFPKGQNADIVETDERQSAEAVVEHFLKLKHRRMACLSTREIAAQTWAVRRRQYFEEAIQKHPEASCKSWRLNVAGDNGLKVARDVLTSSFRPTAVFCVSDHEARLIYRAADELAVRIPEDISVVGFGNLDFAETLTPRLTTLERKPRLMGRLLAELLVERLSNPNQEPSSVRVAADFIEGGSTAEVNESAEQGP